MRRLLVVLCLLALPVLAAAQSREALLTPDGTLFTVEPQVTDADSGVASAYLLLRAQRGADVATEIVPATLDGANLDPAIAYDAESHTLFVFWIRHEGIMGSQLLFAYRDANGAWSEAEAFGQQYADRQNLRIAITRKVTGEDGHVLSTPALSVHLAWWEYDSTGDTPREAAQYAMLSIENGKIAERDSLDLSSFITVPTPDPDAVPETIPEADRNILKQPLLFTSPKQDSVLVVFGDFDTNRLHEVRVHPTKPPVSDGRLRVPVGREEGGANGPRFKTVATGRVEGIYGDSDRMAIYTHEEKALQYLILKDGKWSDAQSITLDGEITSGAAIDALRRLLTEH